METTTHSNFNKFRKFQQPVVTLEDEIKKLSDAETHVELAELIDDRFYNESIDFKDFGNELNVLNYFAIQLAYSPDLDENVAFGDDIRLLCSFLSRVRTPILETEIVEFVAATDMSFLEMVDSDILDNKILIKFWQQIRNYSLAWDEPADLTLNQASMIISNLVALGRVPVALIWLFLRNRIKPVGGKRVNLAQLVDHHITKRKHFVAIDGKTLVIFRNPIGESKLIPVFSGTANDFSKMNNLPTEIINFYGLYKDYLNALACNLVYAKCASRLTRVDKLYQKEMSFSLGDVMKPLRAESINKNWIIDYLKETYVQKRMMTSGNSPDEKHITRLDEMIKVFNKKPANSNFWDGDYTRLINQYERESATRLNIPKYNKFTMPSKRDKSRNSPRDTIIKSNEIIENNISNGISFYPLIVNGDAGMGKTISIHQIAMNYLNRLIEVTDENKINQLPCLPLPIFLKARRLQPSAGDWLESVINGMFDSLPDLIQYISHENVRLLIETWSKFNKLHKSHLTYFVDALDECESKSLVGEIMENAGKLSPILASQSPMIIASTRPSHYQTVRTALGSTKHLIAKMDPEDYYTERELSDLMPQKLCDAWGMTHEPADGLKENLDKCKALIKHPLFVGWICYLLSDKELDESLFVDDLELSQNNIFSKIIDIGINSSLNRNEVNLLYLDENFDKIIRYFVALSYHYSLEKPADVFKKMRNVLGISVSKVGKDVIRRDCGILFLTGKNIEFTHKTIQEVIYADLFDELSDNFHIGNLRADKPVLSRLAQVRYDGSNPIEIVRLDLFYNHLENEEFESKVLEILWDIESENVSDRFRSERRPIICLENDELKPIKEDREEIEIYIAQKYIDAAKNKDPFKLPDSKFRSDKGIREAIYDLSSHPFGTDMIHFSGYYDEEVDGVLCVKGNLVSADYLNLARVNKYTTSLVDVFRYIKTSTFTEPTYGITETDVLSLLTAGMKNSDIKMFDLQGFAFSDDPRAIHGVTEFEMDDIEFISFFWEITGISLPKTFESQCKLFRNSLTHACYGLLFGTNFEERINVLWNEASELGCIYQTGYGEYSNAEHCNLISALLDQIELNPYRDLIHEGHPFPDNLVDRVNKSGNNDNLDLKAIMLFPFVYESLKIIKSGVDPYGINQGINEFLDDAFMRSKGYLKAFELVRAYSDNILK